MRRRYLVAAVVSLLLIQPAFAQVVILDGYRDYPAIISLGSLDAEISKGKLEAARTRRPELEFEIVKLSIKDIVDRNRADRAQQISFASPERFRRWLLDTSRKINRPYDELVGEIVDVVAPNPVPDLTGDSDRYLRERALRNVEQRTAQPAYNSVGEPQPSHEMRTDSTIIETVEGEDSIRGTSETQFTRPPGNPALIKIEDSTKQSKRAKPRK